MDAQKIAQRLYESFDSDDLCEHPEIVDAVEDLADEYEGLKVENAKLKELVSHLMYVKPAEFTAIVYNGKLLRFDEMLAEVGMRFEVEND